MATVAVRRRENWSYWFSLAALVLGVVGLILLPPSRPNSVWNYFYAPCILAATAGVVGVFVALYHRSHRAAFERLIRNGDVFTGEVEGVHRGSRGNEHMILIFREGPAAQLKLVAEGRPFTSLCKAGQPLPCLYQPGKYGAVLLPNDDFALGVWRSR